MEENTEKQIKLCLKKKMENFRIEIRKKKNSETFNLKREKYSNYFNLNKKVPKKYKLKENENKISEILEIKKELIKNLDKKDYSACFKNIKIINKNFCNNTINTSNEMFCQIVFDICKEIFRIKSSFLIKKELKVDENILEEAFSIAIILSNTKYISNLITNNEIKVLLENFQWYFYSEKLLEYVCKIYIYLKILYLFNNIFVESKEIRNQFLDLNFITIIIKNINQVKIDILKILSYLMQIIIKLCHYLFLCFPIYLTIFQNSIFLKYLYSVFILFFFFKFNINSYIIFFYFKSKKVLVFLLNLFKNIKETKVMIDLLWAIYGIINNAKDENDIVELVEINFFNKLCDIFLCSELQLIAPSMKIVGKIIFLSNSNQLKLLIHSNLFDGIYNLLISMNNTILIKLSFWILSNILTENCIVKQFLKKKSLLRKINEILNLGIFSVSIKNEAIISLNNMLKSSNFEDIEFFIMNYNEIVITLQNLLDYFDSEIEILIIENILDFFQTILSVLNKENQEILHNFICTLEKKDQFNSFFKLQNSKNSKISKYSENILDIVIINTK